MTVGEAIDRFLRSYELEGVPDELVDVYRQELIEFWKLNGNDPDSFCYGNFILFITDDAFTDTEQDFKFAVLCKFERFLIINGWLKAEHVRRFQLN